MATIKSSRYTPDASIYPVNVGMRDRPSMTLVCAVMSIHPFPRVRLLFTSLLLWLSLASSRVRGCSWCSTLKGFTVTTTVQAAFSGLLARATLLSPNKCVCEARCGSRPPAQTMKREIVYACRVLNAESAPRTAAREQHVYF